MTFKVTVALPGWLNGVALKVQDWFGFWKTVRFVLGRSEVFDDAAVTVNEAAGGKLFRTLKVRKEGVFAGMRQVAGALMPGGDRCGR